MQTELGHIDEVLAKTFDALPDDLTPIFATRGTAEPKRRPAGCGTGCSAS